jgi:hypothetical protein
VDAGVVVAIVAGAIGMLVLGVLIGRRGAREKPAPPRPPEPRPGEPVSVRRRRFERGGAMELPEDQEWEARRNREVAEHYDSR